MHTDKIQLELAQKHLTSKTRRHFLRESMTGLGAIWMAGAATARGESSIVHQPDNPLSATLPAKPAKAKRIIFMHMLGAPSQLELFDYKPDLNKLHGKECPQEFLEGKRFAFLKGTPLMLGHQFPFKQRGESGAWISDRLPHFAQVADDVCFIKTMQTDQFNHGPAELMVHTGQSRMGYASMGSWITWGLGTENEDLPGFIVLMSGGRLPRAGNALWNGGFLPSVYQGVQCRSQGEPVLDINNPAEITRQDRRSMLDTLEQLNRQSYATFGNPETLTRIAQYEMAYRMQTAVPEVMNISDEPEHIHKLYGTEPGKTSFANNCLLARRLAEKGVRFTQLYDWGWDSRGADKNEALNVGFKEKCVDIDRPMAALIADLKQRGMLEDTLIVWAGEFGRTPMQEDRGNKGDSGAALLGRDHHVEAFTIWLAGAGIKPGFSYGATDPLGYAPTENPVQIRDLHATILHQFGLSHEKLSVPFQGLNQKLTGVKPARVIEEILG